MSWVIPTANQSSTLSLATDQNLFVSAGLVLSSALAEAVDLTGANHRVVVHGTVVGSLGIQGADTDFFTLEVGAGGRVTGLEGSGVAVGDVSAAVVTNAGTIESLGSQGAGLAFSGDPIFFTVKVTNSGSILGDDGIFLFGGVRSSDIANTGLIRGATFAFLDAAGSDDRLQNGGRIVGQVALGGGTDRYDGALGRVTGTVDGGAGADRLIGGAVADILEGGAGRDLLTGGAGADRFVFAEAPGGLDRDVVTDFGATDRIVLDDASFAALAVGALPGSAFAANLTGQAGDASDRIIYETDTGLLRYDPDGAGGAGGSVFAQLSGLPALGAGAFIIE